MFLSVFYPTNVLSLTAISILTVLITLSHKFAVQILIIGIIPYAIIFSAPYLIVALLAGFLASFLISKGYYLKILKEHLSWLHFYSVHPSNAPIGPKLKQIALRNSWYFALAASAAILLLSGNLYFSDITLRIFYWAIIPLIAALIISLPVLSFLGEEYRYIEYSLAPVAIILILTLSSLQSSISTLILLIASVIPAIAFIEYRKYLKKTNSLTNQYDIQAYEILKKKGTENLFVIPHTRTLEVGYFTTLQMIHAVRTNSSSAELQLEHLLKNYKMDYVTHFRNYDKWNQFLILQSAVHLQKVQNFHNFDLYKIDKLSTNPSTQ